MSKDDFLLQYKKSFVLTILSLAAVLMTIQIILDTITNDKTIIIDIILCLTSYAILTHYYFFRNIEKTSILMTLGFFVSAILLFISASYIDSNIYIWILFAPIFIYYLIGFKKGKNWIIVLLVILFLFTLFVFLDILPHILDEEALLQAYLALFFFSLMGHFFQKMTFRITEMLAKKNNRLEETLKELHFAQETLIASEKMAALGSLVSGVAHEVNTPVGTALTGISQIKYSTAELEKEFLNDKMDEKTFLSYLESTKSLSTMSEESLIRAAKLIRSFKEISVDQHSDEKREIDLKRYIDEVIHTLSIELKNNGIHVNNNIPDNITLHTYPGYISQIFSNLILNTVKHAFETTDNNTIIIAAMQKKNKTTITFKDNGKGVSDEVAQKLFDPFFTTARGKGGSGLGLNIVYNLLTSKLNGLICIDSNYKDGLGFIIEIGENDG